MTNTKLCMICRNQIPILQFKEHFINCRSNLIRTPQTKNNNVTQKRSSGCGCGKK